MESLLRVRLTPFCKIVDLLLENKHMGYKWIFKRKMKEDESIDKYKVRFVITGYIQKEDLDYLYLLSSLDNYIYSDDNCVLSFAKSWDK